MFFSTFLSLISLHILIKEKKDGDLSNIYIGINQKLSPKNLFTFLLNSRNESDELQDGNQFVLLTQSEADEFKKSINDKLINELTNSKYILCISNYKWDTTNKYFITFGMYTDNGGVFRLKQKKGSEYLKNEESTLFDLTDNKEFIQNLSDIGRGLKLFKTSDLKEATGKLEERSLPTVEARKDTSKQGSEDLSLSFYGDNKEFFENVPSNNESTPDEPLEKTTDKK